MASSGSARSIVLDANILIRAVLGNRVRQILETHAEDATYFVPETALEEAEEHLAALVVRRGGDPAKALRMLQAVAGLCEVVSAEVYLEFQEEARERLRARDSDDWSILATALALGCSIWTEDADFFRAASRLGRQRASSDSLPGCELAMPSPGRESRQQIPRARVASRPLLFELSCS